MNSGEDKGVKERRSQQPDLWVVWEDRVVYAAAADLQVPRPIGGDARLTGQAPESPCALVLEGKWGSVVMSITNLMGKTKSDRACGGVGYLGLWYPSIGHVRWVEEVDVSPVGVLTLISHCQCHVEVPGTTHHQGVQAVGGTSQAVRCWGPPLGKSALVGRRPGHLERADSGWDKQTKLQSSCSLLGFLRSQEKCRAPGCGAGLEVTTRKRNSPHKTESDAEVILANAITTTILFKGKLQKNKIW